MITTDKFLTEQTLLYAARSGCKSKQVGCVFAKYGNIIAAGWNRPAGNADTCMTAGKCNRVDGACVNNIHAEIIAVLDALKNNPSNIYGCKVYTTLTPCMDCAKVLAELKVTTVYSKLQHSSFPEVGAFLSKQLIPVYNWDGALLNFALS